MKDAFDNQILDTGRALKRGYSFLLENAGKTVALITGLIVTLVTFTEVGIVGVGTAEYTTTLVLMLIASYIIYFSLEEAGEKLGKESEEYRTARDRYKRKREALWGEDARSVRDFLTEYTREELAARQRNLLFTNGYSLTDYNNWLAGAEYPKRTVKVFKRTRRMRPIKITTQQLFAGERSMGGGELKSPEGRKLLYLTLRLIPSTLCMIFTLSVMLGTKDGMTAEFIIESILKLCTLPIIGLKGYSRGYTYARVELTNWTDAKSRLIDAYFRAEKNTKAAG